MNTRAHIDRLFEIALPIRPEELSPEEQAALVANNATPEQLAAYLELKEQYAQVSVPYSYSSPIAAAKGAPCVLACWCHYKDGGKIFIAITKDGETHS